jgi:TPR repeat protein
MQWFRKAADQGLAVAQTNIGTLYEHGLGVPADRKKARYWYELAAKQGYEVAQNRLKGLGEN